MPGDPRAPTAYNAVLAFMRFVWLLVSAVAAAHPMGNFSINRLLVLQPEARGVAITYTVELAEQPAFDLLQAWKIDAKSPELQERAKEQAIAWSRNWAVDERVTPRLERCTATVVPGTAGLPTVRIEAVFLLVVAERSLELEDRNFSGQPGWREIVIRSGPGATLVRASHPAMSRSKGLTAFPDPAPYDSKARFVWSEGELTGTAVIEPIEQPQAPAQLVALPDSTQPAAQSDYLSRLLGRKQFEIGVFLIGLAVAFGFGAMHALSPGHGKTIVAAYLVGARGTLGHALLLGGTVTFTHTVSVFLLGLGTLFLSNYIVPDRIYPILGAISGLSIVVIGAVLLWKRASHALAHHHHRPHTHGDHDHTQHDHDGHHHNHHIEGPVTLGGLLALGASGGLVPCPSALVLLLSSIALGRVGLGLILLVSFSLGLAAVLIAIGAIVLYAKSWLPQGEKTSRHPLFRYLPVASAAVIVCVGLVMTAVSLGWIRPVGGW